MKKNNTLLYCTCILILITLSIKWMLGKQLTLIKKNEKFISEIIKSEVGKQELAMKPILKNLSIKGIHSLPTAPPSPYPFYVFKKGKINYWSNAQLVPPYTDLENKNKYSYINKLYGKFIVRKWEVAYKENSYEVYSLITLYRKYSVKNRFIQSGVNPKIGIDEGLKISSFSTGVGYPMQIKGFPICRIKLANSYSPAIINPFIYIDFTLLILQVILFYALYILFITKLKRFEIFLIIIGWAYFKMILPMLLGITQYATINFFDPQYYAVSWFERSFGDLLINTLFILLISFRVKRWCRNKFFLKALFNIDKKKHSYIIHLVLALITFWIINYPFFQLRSIYNNSQISIDISQSIQIEWIKTITYIIIILINISTLLLYHTIARLFIRYSSSFILQLLLGLLIYMPLSYLADMPFNNLGFINIIILFISWYYINLGIETAPNYKRFLHFASLLCIIIGIEAYFIKEFEFERKVENTQKILAKKLAKKDPFAEFLLLTALNDLSSDPFIINRIGNPFLSKNEVVTKIKQIFLNSYLNKYEQSIVLFDARGEPLKKFEEISIFDNLSEAVTDTANTTLKKPLVLKIEEKIANFSKHYVGYTSIKNSNAIVGYVMIELNEKPFSITSSYPSLLIDNRFNPLTTTADEISFSYYQHGKLVNSVGENEPSPLLDIKGKRVLQADGLLYIVSSEENRAIVASISLNNSHVFLSNFSFLWIVTFLPILIYWLVVSLFKKGRKKPLSYTNRIIWYLNLTFIMPLIVVTAVTFRLISNSFEAEAIFNKNKVVGRLSNQLSISLSHMQHNKKDGNLQKRVEVLSNNTMLDISVFNLKGKLLTTSQPSVFNKKLLSPFINPYALYAIRDKGKNHLFIEEKIDKLIYKNSYAAIKSEDSGQILGLISVPFFSSTSTLEINKRRAFNTILNVFIMVLFTALLITYFAGKWLTRPLKIIRNKLKSTSFSKQTTPIDIQWSDELGLLIKAYNQMLYTLEESKVALKQSEKEKVWREAAQQVAHEIKNPLTPMKLTLQRVNNQINHNNVNLEALKITFQSMLTQIEILNSVASSFSEFAKMPTPKVGRVEVHSIIKKATALFSADKEIVIKLILAQQKVYCMVDPILLSRILNNLLLNAKQAKKEKQKTITVKILTVIGRKLKIHLIDNGVGIDSRIADKVFIPKFTSKKGGLGFGLAMTKFSIENMNGSIYFTSVTNKGAHFTLEFPTLN